MASLQPQVDGIKAAVTSPSTCTPATVATLKRLLLPEAVENTGTKSKNSTRPTKQTARPKPKTVNASTTEALTPKDRTALATHIINTTIKLLTDATKTPQPPATPLKKQPHNGIQQPGGRRTLRRSLSSPLSPLQPRTLNRVATSPSATTNYTKNSSLDVGQSTKYLAIAECARVALACLRSAKGPIKADQTDFQIENGMATLATKLVAIGLNELALMELRVLKKRLEHGSDLESDSVNATKSASGVPDLLDYRSIVSPNSLAVLATCQIQSLKLIAASKKPSHIEAVVHFLRDTNQFCPTNILRKLARSGSTNATKAVRQLASLSQVLLSLSPSVSSSEDHVATEARLSPSPSTAFELQVLAFKGQLMWWMQTGHDGKLDDEILSPFSRCVRCLIRRQPQDDESTYTMILTAFDDMMTLIRSQNYEYSSSFTSPLATIYHSLGSASYATRKYDEACRWYRSLKDLADSSEVVPVRIYSVSARLLAASLKRPGAGTADDETLVEQVLEGFNACLSGTATEVNELLESLSLSRRSVAGILMSNWEEGSPISPSFKARLKKFLLRYPRFVLRWLGTPPDKDASTKHVIQFDQRRQLIMQSIFQVLDGTLTIVKSEIGSASLDWQHVDDVLQHCVLLIRNLNDPASSSAKMVQLGGYHVKISNLYFTSFSQLRRRSDKIKTDRKLVLRALQRSIDTVKDRSPAEKDKAQLSTKLELLADLCKGAGRSDDASKTLRSICTNMVEDGVLSNVSTALASQPPRIAWKVDEKSLALSRTLRSIAKLDDSWNDWTFFLPESERAAVLEHLLQISTEEPSQNKPLCLHDTGMAALLRIYTPERYPIRRLRVLVKLLSQQLGNRQAINDISNLLDQSLRHLQKKDMAEDSSLVRFIPHLRTFFSSVTSLANMDDSFPTSTVKDAIASWDSMVDGCQSEGSILDKIDEPEALLDHLLASDRLAGLKGETALQLSILELSLKIVKTHTGSSNDDLVFYHCTLASRYMDAGMFADASKELSEAKEIIGQGESTSPAATVDFYLSQAEYLAGIENTNEAMTSLEKANSVGDSASTRSRTQQTLALSRTSLVRSKILLRTGDLEGALQSARSTIKGLSHDWNKLDGPSMHAATQPEPSLAESVLGPAHPKHLPPAVFGPRLWALAGPLFDSLMHVSMLYAHVGMFQETVYYCETAERIAQGSGSSLLMAAACAWAASTYVKAHVVDKAIEKATDAERNLPKGVCAARVRIALQLGEVYQELESDEKSAEFFSVAEHATRLLGSKKARSDEPDAGKTARSKATGTTQRTVVSRTTRTKAAAAPSATRTQKRVPSGRSKLAATQLDSAPKDLYQGSLKASVLLSQAMGAVRQRDWAAVSSMLIAVQSLPKVFGALLQEQLINASHHLGVSVEQMVDDPVFSVMHESTISFPTVLSNNDKGGRDRLSAGISPPVRGRAATSERRGVPPFAEALNQAQEILLEAQIAALANGSNAIMHRISTLLQDTVISLTAASSPKIKTAIRTESNTVAVEVARNATWRREQLSIRSSKDMDSGQPPSEPMVTSKMSEQMAGLSLNSDMARFQDEFIELVPTNWSVISVSLSGDQHDLCITKFQAGHSPFILRLPLGRANSRDADSEVFSFAHGREEMLDIVKNANRTSHSGGSLTTKTSRNAWWAEREALDGRLKDLLAAMETTWLGGFKGIFSQHTRRPDLLARFQKSFHQLLERSLPSRSGRRAAKGRAKQPSITLDPRILDLFIGLGDPTDPDCDFDEALNDLLYFVVDILQFHGERNAYDEIDFDAMVVETYDALRGYHAAARSEGVREPGAHTVLVLDKALHGFPWESMPCMENLAVSRVPSLAALRRLITESRKPAAGAQEDDMAGGHYVSAKAGTYMLNPSSDLTNTQAYFEPSFSSLSSWTRLVNKEPTERDFEEALSASDVFLYFGHGSGAQYIRGKTVRRLERCRPATFLMGCSSAALNAAGEFECYGPVWNYMTAGCPAVVGTLWDVTDRDIDRFAGRAFEEWGLFPRGTFKDRKGKAKQGELEESSEMDSEAEAGAASLAEAVTRARAACRFKYLNAAAVVMYGIPVYIEKEEEA